LTQLKPIQEQSPPLPGAGRAQSVRGEAADTDGPVAPDRVVAVAVDAMTGSFAGAGDLFTDVDAADRLMRAERTAAVAKLTIEAAAGGLLAWHPAPDGLHWVVAPCAVADCAAGPVQAVVPWAGLADVTRS
jgi:hypothetical protein